MSKRPIKPGKQLRGGKHDEKGKKYVGGKCGRCHFAIPALSMMLCIYPENIPNWENCEKFQPIDRDKREWWRHPWLLNCEGCEKDKETCPGIQDMADCRPRRRFTSRPPTSRPSTGTGSYHYRSPKDDSHRDRRKDQIAKK